MPRLRIKVKDNYEDISVTDDTFSIGRADECHYTIESGYVSRRHCEIHHRSEGFVLQDLGSKLGTYLNGERVEGTVPLNLGDRIKFANRLEAIFMGGVAMSHTETMVAQRQDLQQDSERLVALNGPLSGREYPLYLNLTRLGRASDNHVHIPVDTVSSYHAEITRDGNSFVIRDLESGNGTYVNDERITRKTLQPGDLVRCDWVNFRFEHVHFRMEAEGTRIHGELVGSLSPEDILDRTLQMEVQPTRPTERLQTQNPPEDSKSNSGFGRKLALLALGISTMGVLWYLVLTYLL